MRNQQNASLFTYLDFLHCASFRVPLGFVCGYPVGSGGELYGGSMFVESAATDTLQGRAIQTKNEKWGRDDVPRHPDLETKNDTTVHIGVPVCKKKYAPFLVHRKGDKFVVERRYGCHCHSHIRKKVIEKYGERRGWEPFGQWSLRKAQVTARKMRSIEVQAVTSINTGNGCLNTFSTEERGKGNIKQLFKLKAPSRNDSYTWKFREKYDDIRSELQDEIKEITT